MSKTKKKKKKLDPQPAVFNPAKYITEAGRKLPIVFTAMTEHWQIHNMAMVWIGRQRPNGQIVVGHFLVDTALRGVKDAFFNFFDSLKELEDLVKKTNSSTEPLSKADANHAQYFVYAAVAYAKKHGVNPVSDFRITQYLLDPIENLTPVDFEFGIGGKPVFLSGPYDHEYDEQILDNLLFNPMISRGERLDVTNMAISSENVLYRIKISLDESENPQIWRTLEVKKTTKLYEFNSMILMAFGWSGGHMHIFRATDGTEFMSYGDDYEADDNGSGVLNEGNYTIAHLFHDGKCLTGTYTYDFGDDWVHSFTLENQGDAIQGVKYPRLIAGQGSCPPEDCGGIDAYYEMVEIVKNPDDEQYEDMCDWLFLEEGEEWNMDNFDLEAESAQISKVFGR
jgi:Plasmid pRiA4b ORF-3-like protein